MKYHLKGISFLLFAIVLMLYAVVGSPWLPIIGSISSDLISTIGLVSAVIGLVLSCKKES